MRRGLLAAGVAVWVTLVSILLVLPEPLPGRVVSVDTHGRVTN